jgi:hypothetical protein
MNDDAAAQLWDAQAEHDVGALISTYLKRHPAPAGALLYGDLHRWSENLRRDGQVRLEELGQRSPLRAVV